MSDFVVYPAIDLRGGQVVRLAQGDPAREKRYARDPAPVARRWLAEGAEWLHVVNLDGALDEGTAENLDALERILKTGAKVQFGGGLRRMEHVRAAFDRGVARVVFGTAAVESPELVEKALAAYGRGRVALGIDARDGRAWVRGWKEVTPLDALELGAQFTSLGGAHAVVTDISRDGMGTGLNLTLAQRIQGATGLKVIASGGAAAIADVSAARRARLAGVILGRAIYDGRIPLAEALRC